MQGLFAMGFAQHAKIFNTITYQTSRSIILMDNSSIFNSSRNHFIEVGMDYILPLYFFQSF